jgi:hypothetical protein
MNATASNTDGTQSGGLLNHMTAPLACELRKAIVAIKARAPRAMLERRPAAAICTVTMVQTAMLLLAPDAQAQSNACDLLKSELAARIEATGVRGYSLEDVPADTPVPPGAKAIGNCEGGARKVLYRRWAAVQGSSADTGAAVPASAALPRVVPDKPPPRSIAAQADRAAPPAAGSAPGPAPRSCAASASSAACRDPRGAVSVGTADKRLHGRELALASGAGRPAARGLGLGLVRAPQRLRRGWIAARPQALSGPACRTRTRVSSNCQMACA